MNLSPVGHVVFDLWKNIPNYFPYVVLDEFVIMPDHIHGIIVIDIPDDGSIPAGGAINRAPTVEKIKAGGITGIKNPMLHQNLSRIIRWFKGRSTFECLKIKKDFIWQSGFHDHIIRDRKSHERIRKYIRNNFLDWLKNKINRGAINLK